MSKPSGFSITTKTYAAPDAVADVVQGLWAARWSIPDGHVHTVELLADPCVNLVCERDASGTQSRLVGVSTSLFRRELVGTGAVRGVKLRPGGVRAFVDASASMFRDLNTELHTLCTETRSLERDVLCESDEEGFAAFATWLKNRRRREDPNVSLAVAIVERLQRDHEILRVEQLCTIAGLSIRPLQRLFKDYVGATPKWLIRRHRLQEVATRIDRGEAPNFADLAAELGYTDQAHLTRDFRAATGLSPSGLRARLAE